MSSILQNYSNKYPPMGLMKLATYYRKCGDDVRFFKGDMRNLAAELICEDLLNYLEVCFSDVYWRQYYPTLFDFIKLGKYSILDVDPVFEDEEILDALKQYRKKYKNKEYFEKPRFDKVGITTLFTFYWDILSVGVAFLVRKSTDVPPRITGDDVSKKEKKKKLILDDQLIPGLLNLIRDYKNMAITDSNKENYSEIENESTTDRSEASSTEPAHDENEIYSPAISDRFIPKQHKQEYLAFSQEEADGFLWEDNGVVVNELNKLVDDIRA